MSNFTFLSEWPALHEAAQLAEGSVNSEARGACFHARRALEWAVRWMYTHDPACAPRPYDDNLNALLRATPLVRLVPQPVQNHADLVRRAGNEAVHGARAVTTGQALVAVQDLWQVLRWFAWSYRQDAGVPLPTAFDPAQLPPAQADLERLSRQQLAELQAGLEREAQEAEALRRELATREAERAELAALRARVAGRRARNTSQPGGAPQPKSAQSEAETRARLIDVLLREAGWNPDAPDVREFPVEGLPTRSGRGRVDYVLWGDDGLPLAVVEAKRTGVDAQDGRQQAKLYADALQARYGQRPVIFYSNGTSTYLWDDLAFGAAGGYPPRQVAGFCTRAELALLIQRRQTRLAMSEHDLNPDIAGRPYQVSAIRAFTEHLTARHRKGLIVMATGTGKTRTAAAIVELLQRAGWVKRVLFLADRKALVEQTTRVFRKLLPGGSVQNLLETRAESETARVVVSTYQTILQDIETGRLEGGARRFGVGHFDLVIVDEAHRSIYRSFGALFQYFDAYLLGLTATPRGEVDRNTYRLFEMEDGVPLYSYSLEEAVRDGYLVPPRGEDATPGFLQRGIRYDDLSEDEQDEYDALEWEGLGGRREEIGRAEINSWLFNASTVDEVLRHLMQRGLKVAGGDVLGKTIVFAANHRHALYIVQRFEASYPHLAGFARVVDTYDRYAASLIEDFSAPARWPNIAVSVDMLDTGIDVPEVVNLVVFKVVRSRTKFTQMIGRGTRLCPDLFGPGQHKTHFNVFDYCGNFVFFGEHPAGIEGRLTEPVSQRLFRLRLDLLRTLASQREGSEDARDLYATFADELHARVAAMPAENVLVRPHRALVERFAQRPAWDSLNELDLTRLARDLSGLPSATPDGDEDARRFDELVARWQLARLRGGSEMERLTTRLQDTAERLAQKGAVPDVQRQLGLLGTLQDPESWAEMTPEGLETVRGRLRDLTGLLDREDRAVVYTDFQDHIEGSPVSPFPDLAGAVNVAQYRKKVEAFVRERATDPVLLKIRTAQPLASADLAHLEALLFQAGDLDSRLVFEQVYGQQENLALFIRRLVGLDRRAAGAAFARYLDGQLFSAAQISFVETLIEALSRSGVIEPGLLYEPPFTAEHHAGLDGLFPDAQADDIVQTLRRLNASVIPTAQA